MTDGKKSGSSEEMTNEKKMEEKCGDVGKKENVDGSSGVGKDDKNNDGDNDKISKTNKPKVTKKLINSRKVDSPGESRRSSDAASRRTSLTAGSHHLNSFSSIQEKIEALSRDQSQNDLSTSKKLPKINKLTNEGLIFKPVDKSPVKNPPSKMDSNNLIESRLKKFGETSAASVSVAMRKFSKKPEIGENGIGKKNDEGSGIRDVTVDNGGKANEKREIINVSSCCKENALKSLENSVVSEKMDDSNVSKKEKNEMKFDKEQIESIENFQNEIKRQKDDNCSDKRKNSIEKKESEIFEMCGGGDNGGGGGKNSESGKRIEKNSIKSIRDTKKTEKGQNETEPKCQSSLTERINFIDLNNNNNNTKNVRRDDDGKGSTRVEECSTREDAKFHSSSISGKKIVARTSDESKKSKESILVNDDETDIKKKLAKELKNVREGLNMLTEKLSDDVSNHSKNVGKRFAKESNVEETVSLNYSNRETVTNNAGKVSATTETTERKKTETDDKIEEGKNCFPNVNQTEEVKYYSSKGEIISGSFKYPSNRLSTILLSNPNQVLDKTKSPLDILNVGNFPGGPDNDKAIICLEEDYERNSFINRDRNTLSPLSDFSDESFDHYLTSDATTSVSTSLVNRSRDRSSRSSSIPRRIFPQTSMWSNRKMKNRSNDKNDEESSVVFDASMSFDLSPNRTSLRHQFKPRPAFKDENTNSNSLSAKITEFLHRTDHIMEEWRHLGKEKNDLESLVRLPRNNNVSGISESKRKSATNIMIKGLLNFTKGNRKNPRMFRSRSCTGRTSEMSDRTISDVDEVGNNDQWFRTTPIKF